MESATATQPAPAPAPAPAPTARRRRGRSLLRPFAFMSAPTILLGLLFVAPMIVMGVISLQHGVLSGDSGFTLSNYTDVLKDPLYRDVAWTTVQIATVAMLIQLAIAIPVAYVLAYKAGRFEIPLLLALVLADELNPMVRIYAWRMLLGREGLINDFLTSVGAIDQPIDALLFSKFAVIVVLSTSYLTYTVIPIYAAMKAVDANLFEAARDLGAGWWTTFRRVLVPLIAPGIFIALLLVYIPLFTDFASPTLVGGTSGYMLGQVVNDLVLETGDLNAGAAMSLLMLFASGIFALVAYRLAKIRQLEQ
jgi:ABC-type spermidine/putrescine transport system permease subunit I